MADGQQPNVVFFIVDDTPHENLGTWGGTTPTPNIDRLAARGVRFDRAFCTAAICQPSRYSYLTGRYPSTNPDPVFLKGNRRDEHARVSFNTYVNADIPSMGKLFREAGYRTGFAGKWHVGHPRPMLGVPEFDTDASPDAPGIDEKLRELEAILEEEVCSTGGYDFAGGIIWGNNADYPLKALNDHHIEWSTQAALDFLDSCGADRPFLLHYGSTCTHGPNAVESLARDWHHTLGGKVDESVQPLPPREGLADRLREMGLPVDHQCVSALWIDDQVGALVRKLEEMGALENTIFIFCADHNVEPGKATCYDRGTRVPLLISWPPMFDQGRVCDALVQNIDLMPTLLNLCGIELHLAPAFDGIDLAGLLRGEVESVRDDLYLEVGYTRAVRTDRWKYIALRFTDAVIDAMRTGQLQEAPNHMDQWRQQHAHIALCNYPGYYDQDQLYDLAADPGEKNNLASDTAHADVLNEMQARLRGHLARLPHPFDLARQGFLDSTEFAELADRTRAVGTDFISWWNQETGRSED
jgi:arylsulfatase A-like enzyme